MKTKSILFLSLLGAIALSACQNSGNSSSNKVSSNASNASSSTIKNSSVMTSTSSTSTTTSTSSNTTSSSSSSTTTSSSMIQYTKIEDVRNEITTGEEVTIKGIVVKHNYTGQSTPYITGFWMADATGSIYIYGEDSAKSVEVGNEVVVKGIKGYYIPNTDTSSAESLNYKGMLQLSSPTIIENDGGDNEIPASAITTTTVAEINNIPLTNDITGNIYKVKGRWSVVAQSDFTNYYLNDLNREDSIMAYTQSNGKDYAWTNENDGKTVEMLIIVSLGKPGVNSWRMCPVEFLDTDVQVSAKEEATYALDRLLAEFSDTYNTDTDVVIAVEDQYLQGSVRSISSTSDQISITTGERENVVSISASKLGKITLDASVTYNGETVTGTKEIDIVEKLDYETISIAEAREKADEEIVTLEAIVAKITYKGSMTKQGLFLVDNTGSIFAYFGTSFMDQLGDVEDGNKVIIKGTLTHYVKNANNAVAENYSGDLQLSDPEILNIDTNVNSIPTSSYIESTITDITSTLPSNNISSNIYKVRAKVVKNTGYATSYNLQEVDGGTASLPLYSQNSGNDFKWLDEYEGTEITIIVGIQNLNLKASGSNWRGCPIQVIAE